MWVPSIAPKHCGIMDEFFLIKSPVHFILCERKYLFTGRRCQILAVYTTGGFYARAGRASDKKPGFSFAQGLDPLLYTSLVISETTCQLAHRGVEKLLRWQLKKIIGRVIGITIISDSIVGLYPCWTSIYLSPWIGNESPVQHSLIKRKFLCLKWSIFQLASFRIFSFLSALKLMIYQLVRRTQFLACFTW